MKKLSVGIILFWGFVQVSGQNDSIFIDAKLSSNQKIINVSQRLVYYNNSNKELSTLKLFNWVSAYQKNGTDLSKRKLEDRSSLLYFAKSEETGRLLELKIKQDDKQESAIQETSEENIFLGLNKPLKPGEKVVLNLQYQMQLPDKKFTGYGTSPNTLALKYFFIVPDRFDPDNIKIKNFIDTEEPVSFNTYWYAHFDLPKNLNITSNLTSINDGIFEGTINTDPEFIISKQKFSSLHISTNDFSTEIKFGYELTPSEKQNLEFYLPLQLSFLQDRIGNIPKEIFISEKFKNSEDFWGSKDINFWKYNFKRFSDAEKIDLDYFGIITKKILDEKIIANKEEQHWFKNGLKSYLEIDYLKKFYKDSKLLGNLPDEKIWGMKPLKIFHASKVKLIDRYGLPYQYMMSQNLDQKINEKYSALNNFNEMAISSFEMGTLFDFSADKMGKEQFNEILQKYIQENKNKEVNSIEFFDEIAKKDPSNAYLAEFINKKNRVNFKLKKFKFNDDQLEVSIKKNTDKAIPVLLNTETKEGITKSYWVETEEKERIKTVTIPAENVYKITLNDDYSFPESNFSDNFLYTKGLFSNAKKIKFKLIKDIPNPEFTEVYLSPRIRFPNAYDQFLLGVNIKNQSFFEQKFLYSLTPSFSTGTGQITGSGSVSYSFLPTEGIFRSITFGVSGAYYHYDYDLAYRKGSLFSVLSFKKDPRSTVSSSISMSYNYFEKDLNEKMIAQNDYSKYNIWSIGYGYSDSKLIHEKSFSISTQGMEDFNKLTAEGFYRWEFAPRQKLSLRFFAGYFFRNNARTTTFDFGISKVSNYSFSYSLLGESASSGFLSQQFILADGGFKSLIPGRVNNWLTSFNVDTSVWKIFSVYADAGLYKNKNQTTQFIWDSGIKLRLIPDFLEIYFPIQSTLGFEPGLKDYAKRIRYTLVLNLNSILNSVRRGWY